jgi:tetratricopeptide (TPR) repeat protein
VSRTILSAVLLALGFASRATAQDTKAILDAPTGGRPAVIQFKEAHELLVGADDTRDRGNTEEALRQYREAQKLYEHLARKYPDWERGVTQFRMAYCESQIGALDRRAPAGVAPPPAPIAEEVEPAEPAALPAAATPRLVRALCVEAVDRLRANQPEKAQELLMRAMDADPDGAAARLLLGVAHCRRGDYENALYLLKPLVEDHPRDARAHVALGAAYFGLGRFLSAEEHLRRATVLNPDLAEAHFDLAQLLAALKPPEKERARKHYQRALELGGKPDPALAKELQLP